jgi:hypothetical protein
MVIARTAKKSWGDRPLHERLALVAGFAFLGIALGFSVLSLKAIPGIAGNVRYLGDIVAGIEDEAGVGDARRGIAIMGAILFFNLSLVLVGALLVRLKKTAQQLAIFLLGIFVLFGVAAVVTDGWTLLPITVVNSAMLGLLVASHRLATRESA